MKKFIQQTQYLLVLTLMLGLGIAPLRAMEFADRIAAEAAAKDAADVAAQKAARAGELATLQSRELVTKSPFLKPNAPLTPEAATRVEAGVTAAHPAPGELRTANNPLAAAGAARQPHVISTPADSNIGRSLPEGIETGSTAEGSLARTVETAPEGVTGKITATPVTPEPSPTVTRVAGNPAEGNVATDVAGADEVAGRARSNATTKAPAIPPRPYTSKASQITGASEAEIAANIAKGRELAQAAEASANKVPTNRLAKAKQWIKNNPKTAIAGGIIIGGVVIAAATITALAIIDSTKKKGSFGPGAGTGSGDTGSGSIGNINTGTQQEDNPTAPGINVPADVIPEAGNALSIAVGSRNGGLEVWAISQDGSQLLRYDSSEVNAENPWVAQDKKNSDNIDLGNLQAVSASSDGVLMVLDSNGKAYTYDWDNKYFTSLSPSNAYTYDSDTGEFTEGDQPLVLSIISAGSASDIWAVDSVNQIIYQLNVSSNMFEPRGMGIDVAAGADNTIMSIDATNVPQAYAGTEWEPITGVELTQIAVGSENYVYGTATDGSLWQFTNDAWVQILGANGKPTSGINQVAINAVGTLFITDSNDAIYNRGNDAVQVTDTVIAQTPAGPTVVVTPTEQPEEPVTVVRTIEPATPKKKSRFAAKAKKNSPLRKKVNVGKKNKTKNKNQGRNKKTQEAQTKKVVKAKKSELAKATKVPKINKRNKHKQETGTEKGLIAVGKAKVRGKKVNN